MWLYDELSDDPAVGALHQALFNFPAPLPFATQGQIGTLDGAQDTDYVSVYGHTTWRPARRFAVNTGLRWQDEQKDAHVIQRTNDPAPSIISLILAPAVVSTNGLHRDTRELTWSVTPQWFVSDTTMLFTTLAHGFKSGGFNVGFGRLPIADREFQDEDVEHFEMASRASSRTAAFASPRARFRRTTTTIRTPRSSARNLRSATPRKSSSRAWSSKARRC